MAQTIKLKNSGTSSNTPSSLEHGELAINYADGKIFYKNSSNSIVEFANLSGSFLPLSGGTLSGPINMGSQNISGINNATAVSFLSTNGYWVGGVQRINGSGNLINIGTISSGAITSSGNLVLDAAGHNYIELHSATANTRKWRFYNGQGWNQDALLIYDQDADQTAVTIETGKLGINRGASSLSHNLDVGGSVAISGTQILDSLRNLSNIGTISSGAITVDHTDGTDNISLTPTSTGGVINARNSSGTSVVVMDGRGTPFIDVTGNLKTGGTTRIDSSGNLSSIGTISSGAITSTGLTVNGDGVIQDATPTLEFKDTDNNLIASVGGASGSLLLKADTGGGTSGESMQFHTGGSEVARFDSSGRLGLGTTSPSFPFDLHHLTPEINLKDLSSTAQFRITLDGVDTSIQNKGSAGHVIFTTQNGSGQEFERMRLEPSGEIHITSGGPAIEPTIKHANATEGSSAKLRVINRSGQAGDKGGILELGGVTDDGVSRADVFASIAGLKTNSTSANRQGFMQFLTSNGVSLTERMRLTAFGKLGLGTTNPSNILDCTGSISNDYVAAFENTDSTNGYGLLAKTAHTGTSAFAFGAYGGSNALMVVRGDGQVAIGTVNPNSYTNQRVLTINGTTHSRIDFETGSTLRASVYGDSGSLNIDALGNFTRFYTGNSEKMRLDSLGNLLVGTTSSYGDKLNINGTGHFTSNLTLSRQTNDSGSTGLILEKTRNTSVDGNTVVQAGDQLGYIAFRGNDGDQFLDGAFILSFVDGTPSNNDMPTNLQFWTTSDGASSPSERMRIDSSGNVGVGVSSPQTRFHVESSDGSGIRVSRSGATAHMQLFPAYSNVPTIMGLGAGGLHLGYNSNTDGIRIATNNNVGIGTTSPAEKVHIVGNTFNTGQIRANTGTAANPNFTIDGGTGMFKPVSNVIAFSTNSQERVRINVTGMGIGTTSPTHKLDVRYDVAASTDLDPSSVRLYNNSDGGAGIFFENGVSAKSKISFGVEGTGASTDETFIGFSTGANTSMSERMRIDSSGNLLVGKTAADFTVAGHEIRNGSYAGFTRAGLPLLANRLSSDGDIIEFYKNTASIGSIGVNSGYFYLGGTQGTDAFLSFGASGVRPATSSGDARDAAIDLGSSSNRFKDAYFSGTITGGQDFKATGSNMKLHAGGNHIINMDLNGKFYPQTHNAVDLGHSSTLAFKDLYLSGSANIGTNILMSNSTTSAFMQVSSDILQFGTSSNDPVAFFANNTERMRLDSSGNVGIGTALPNQWASYTDSAATVLQVQDTSQRARLVINGGNGAHLDLVDYAGGTNDKHMNIAVDGGILKFGSLNDAGSAFVQNNILVMDLGTGNCGLGTTLPDSLLHLKSTGDTRMTIESPDANDSYINFSGATNEMSLGFDTSDAAMYITNHGTITANRRVTIKTNGAVSIGTTTTTGAGGLLVDNDIKTNSRFGVGSLGNVATPAIHVLADTDTGIYFPDFNHIGLVTGGVERLQIDNSGNIGGGGNDPQYPLDLRNPSDSNQIFRVQFPDANTVQIGTTRMGTGATQNVFLEGQDGVRFGVSGSEFGRFNSGGHFLVNTTSLSRDTATSGTSAHLSVSASYPHILTRQTGTTGSSVLLLNDTGAGGAIIELKQDGSRVGAVGTVSDNIYIGTGDTGLYFNATNDSIYPINTSTIAGRDNGVDLGKSDTRFQDAHFAGTINTRALTVENDISGDAALRIKSTSGGDPIIYLNSSAANRSGLIRYQDNGVNIGRIEYVHNGDRIDMRAGSATGITMSVVNSGVMIGSTTPSKTLKVEFSDTNTSTTNGGTKGLEIKNTATATNTYAPIHFHANQSFGRIALKNVDGNEEISQFEFIVADDGSAVNAMTIGSTGNVTITGSCTATSFPTSSDARLKDNIEDAKDSGDIIDKIKVRQFDWKKTGKHQDYGMIAQELILEVPDAVSTPTEDHEMMGVDYSKLVPLMMKEIQNLRKEIKSLKEKE